MLPCIVNQLQYYNYHMILIISECHDDVVEIVTLCKTNSVAIIPIGGTCLP